MEDDHSRGPGREVNRFEEVSPNPKLIQHQVGMQKMRFSNDLLSILHNLDPGPVSLRGMRVHLELQFELALVAILLQHGQSLPACIRDGVVLCQRSNDDRYAKGAQAAAARTCADTDLRVRV
jgi:hypothetical protein